jgi:hypothetical protein
VICARRSAGSKGLFHAAIGLSGSPNISMAQPAKEAQDTAMWLPRTPCANASHQELLPCLHAADAGELLRSIPPKYEVFTFADKYDYPVNRAGLRTAVAALVHVDGVTITDPLEASLRRGLHSDVPIPPRNCDPQELFLGPKGILCIQKIPIDLKYGKFSWGPG